MINNKKKFIISIVFLGFFNLAFLFGAYFLSRTIEARKDLVVDIKKQLLLYEKRIDRIKELEGALTESREDYLKISSVLVDKESIVDFIEELEFLAGHTNVDLEMKGIRLVEAAGEKPIFTASLTGSFVDIYHYLFLLENDIYQIEFGKVDIKKTEGVEEWEAFLEIELLSYRE